MQSLSNFINAFNRLLAESAGPTLKHKALATLFGALLTYIALGRLLLPDYQFVGNDADLSFYWIHSTKFFRLWLHAGVKPTWNPFAAGGYPLLRPEEFYLAGVNLWQWLLPVSEKALDQTLFLHSLILMLGSLLLFLSFRFSLLAALAAAAAFSFTGTPAAQLFAGHINLYCTLCWAPFALLSFRACLRRSSICWTLLHALILSLAFSYGSLQGFYMICLLNVIWHGTQILSGLPWLVPALQFRETCSAGQGPEPCFTDSSVPSKRRARDLLYFLLRLTLAFAVCFQLTTCYWLPQLSNGGGYAVTDNLYANHAAPYCWLTLLIPHFFLGPGQEYSWTYFSAWEGAPGVGGSFLFIFAIGCMLSGWRKLPLPAVATLLWGAMAGLAWNSPLWPVMRAIDPFLTCFEAPSRLYFVCNFAEAVLLAWALQQLIQHRLVLPSALLHRVTIALSVAFAIWVVAFYADASNPLWKLFFRSLMPTTSGRGYYVLLWTRYSAEFFLWLGYWFTFARMPQVFRLLAVSFLLSVDLLHYPLAFLNFRPNEQLNVPEYAAALFREKKIEGSIANLFDPKWNGQMMILPQHESGNFKESGQWERQLAARLAESKMPEAKGLQGNLWSHPNSLYRLLGVELYLRNRDQLEAYKTNPAYANFTLYDIKSKDFVALRDSLQRAPVYLTRSAMPISGPRQLITEMSDSAKFLSHMDFLSPRTYTGIANSFAQRGWQQRYRLDPNIPETATIVKETPNELHVSCQLQAPAILVVNAPYSEEWKASVNGRNETVWPAQWGLNRSVLLDAGQHKIVFYHEDTRAKLIRANVMQLLTILLILTGYFGYRTVLHSLKDDSP